MTQDWKEEFDKEWKEGLLYCFGYENPESGREKRVVAEQAYLKLTSSIESILKEQRLAVLEEVLNSIPEELGESERNEIYKKGFKFCREATIAGIESLRT